MDPTIDFGCISFMRPEDYPLELRRHFEDARSGEEHKVTVHRAGRCINEFHCLTCGIKWNLDTGD